MTSVDGESCDLTSPDRSAFHRERKHETPRCQVGCRIRQTASANAGERGGRNVVGDRLGTQVELSLIVLDSTIPYGFRTKQ